MNEMYKPEYVKIIDPLVGNKAKCKYPILQGGMETTERVFSSNNVSQNNLQFSVPPPSPQTFISRRFLLRLPVTVTLQSDQPGNSPTCFRAGFDAFRSFPIASIIQTLNISLNGQSVTLDMSDICKPLLLYHNNCRDLANREFSMTPAMRDQSQYYTDLVATGASDATYNRNPLNSFKDSMERSTIPRGAFRYDQIEHTDPDPNGKITSIISGTLTEELFISPLLFGGVEDDGFIGLQKLEINITFVNDLGRIWSHASNGNTNPNFTVLSVNISAPTNTIPSTLPAILFRYVTPPVSWSARPYYQYSYNEINRYKKTYGTVPSYATDSNDFNTIYQQIRALGTVEMSTDNLQLNAIPRFIYLFARKQYGTSDTPWNLTDSYLSIRSVRISWNNSNALLSDASQQQLYDISRKNGVDLDYLQWSGYPMVNNAVWDANNINTFVGGIGSVLCIEMGTDIGLRPGEAPGLIGTYNIQCYVDVTNYSGQAIDNVELVMMTVTPGIFTIYQNSASKRIGILDKSTVMGAREMAGHGYYRMRKNLMSGGRSFFKSLRKKAKNIGKKVLGKKGYKDIKGIGKKALKDTRAVARQAAHSAIQNAMGGQAVGGRRRRRKSKKKRSHSVGGRKRSRSRKKKR